MGATPRGSGPPHFPIDTYLIASWFDWQFGGSYGHRGFTDGLGVLAIFLAAFFAWTAERPRPRFVAALAIVLAMLLSTAQMLQYWVGICRWRIRRGNDAA